MLLCLGLFTLLTLLRHLRKFDLRVCRGGIKSSPDLLLDPPYHLRTITCRGRLLWHLCTRHTCAADYEEHRRYDDASHVSPLSHSYCRSWMFLCIRRAAETRYVSRVQNRSAKAKAFVGTTSHLTV